MDQIGSDAELVQLPDRRHASCAGLGRDFAEDGGEDDGLMARSPQRQREVACMELTSSSERKLAAGEEDAHPGSIQSARVIDRPELACVVLAVGNPPALIAAVRSLIEQNEPVEVAVINSGGQGAAASLVEAGFDVKVIEIPERVLPGAARNRGIAATNAPYVSFLAADCVAEPEWASARLRAHRAGAVGVASAVTNPFTTNVSAWTSYIALFNRRMPGIPPPHALLYGVSYARRLFDDYGFFREDMRGGEDTDFHQRLSAGGVVIVWEPGVRTAHRHPTRLVDLLRDQFRRGARTALAWERLRGPAPMRVATNAFQRLPSTARLAWRAVTRAERKWVAAAAVLLPLAAMAYAAGSIAHAVLKSGKDEE